MTPSGVNEILAALNQAGVRYLVAGGLAVVAHGHVRLTEDIDLVLDLESLLEMKRKAGRARELLDVEVLTQLREQANHDAAG